uniref:Homeobox domain-containing protein n=1 Tax=Syphacia muris TaxID=451379 RepID=A0A0N5AK89_9BILA
MSLPYPYYFPLTDQFRSCLPSITTPSSSSLSTFSIDSLLSAPVPMPILPSVPFTADLITNSWRNVSTHIPFMPAGFPCISAGIMSPFNSLHYNGKRKRRHRTIFSEEQLQILENAFHGTHYPDVMLREKLAEQCALKEERVEVWFKNRRAKDRKQKRENDGKSNGTSGKLSVSDESDYGLSDDENTTKKMPNKRKRLSIDVETDCSSQQLTTTNLPSKSNSTSSVKCNSSITMQLGI